MHQLLARLAGPLTPTGVIPHDAASFLAGHGCRHTIGHSARVAAAARQIAERCGADPQAAAIAGWLHDISTVIPNSERVGYAEAWGVDVLPEERQVPMIVHQKLSAYMARHLFQVADGATLRAIECHTTLRAGASTLDSVVFIADKLKWDGEGDPPYLAGLEAALECSVDAAATWFVTYLWERRDTLLVIHPWLAEAYGDLCAQR